MTSKRSPSGRSPHVAEFSLTYDSAATATRVERSLRPEVDDIDGDRTSASLSRTGADLTCIVEAEDLVALRAGLNTWLTLATVAEQAGGVAAGGPAVDDPDA